MLIFDDMFNFKGTAINGANFLELLSTSIARGICRGLGLLKKGVIVNR